MGEIVNFSKQFMNNKGEKLDPTTVVGTGQAFETIDELLAITNVCRDGMIVQDFNNSVAWQVYFDGETPKARIYDGMVHVKALSIGDIVYPHGQTTVDGETITYGDIVFQAGGLPQLRGLWVYSDAAPGQDSTHSTPCDGYVRHPLFDTVEDQLANVIIIVDGGDTWKGSQWVCTTIGSLTGCDVDSGGEAASPELLHWYYWAARPTDLGLGNTEYSDLVGTGMSDSWLNFDPVSTQALGSTKYTEDANIGLFSYFNYIDATSGPCDAYTYYDSNTGYIIMNVNKEYFVQKVDSTNNYVAFYEDGAGGELPTSILIEKDDWCKTILYQNPADVEDVEFFTHSNRKTKIIDLGTLTADGYTGVDIPAGYAVFMIKGTTDAGDGDFSVGITASPCNELLDEIEFTAGTGYGGPRINCYGNLAANLTSPSRIYVKQTGGWGSGNPTSITMQMVIYEVLNVQSPCVTNVAASTYNTTDSDEILNVSYTSTGTVAIQIMDTRLALKTPLVIKDSGGGAATYNITISTEGAATIDGQNTYVMNSNYQAIEIYSDGSNFYIK